MLLFLTFFTLIPIILSLTTQQYEAIVKDIYTYLLPPTYDYLNSADFLGGVIRLPFHDAGSYDINDNSGRPSGCINSLDPANGGLMEVINGIEPVYQMHKTELSRADFWPLVAQVAIKAYGGPHIVYVWGREDCNGSYPPMGRLINNEGNFTDLTNFFIKRMGLEVRDIVALLGAHTVGRCMPENSGYQFYWTRMPHIFTNVYYQDLLTLQWKRTQNKFAFHNITTEWNDPAPTNGTPSVLRLNADISLVYNIGYGNEGDCNSTDSNQCTYNDQTYEIVKEFANSEQKWFLDFGNAWVKLTSLGYNNLQPLISG